MTFRLFRYSSRTLLSIPRSLQRLRPKLGVCGAVLVVARLEVRYVEREGELAILIQREFWLLECKMIARF